MAQYSVNMKISPRIMSLLMIAGYVMATRASSNNEETLSKRQTNNYLFKGAPIASVNWTSSDIYNFTWGLTGVNNFENLRFAQNLVATLGTIVAIIFVYRIFVAHLHHVRLIASVGSVASANYFSQPLSKGLCFIQKHILISPLFRRRHNEPLQTRWGQLYLGTLPSRINASFLFAYILSNVLYCTLLLPWNGRVGPDNKFQAPTKAYLVSEFRGRTGVMATVNLIPLFVCMMRNNYVGKSIGVSFNTWNLYHRWAGRIVTLEAFAHMGAWTVNNFDYDGWSGIVASIRKTRFLQMGLMAECALFLIVILSIAPIRHAHYQVFLGSHQICIVFMLIGAWLHCYIDLLPQRRYVTIAMGIWMFERLHRLFTIYRKNLFFGRKWSANAAEIQVVASGEDAVRVSITMNKGWEYKPGQHAYLYIPRLSWTQSHPFSIAWSSVSPSVDESNMLPLTPVSTMAVVDDKSLASKIDFNSTTTLAHRNLLTTKPRTTIHFIISRRHGFTGRLFTAAARGARNRFLDPEKVDDIPKRFLAFVEGPYSNESHSFDSFSTLLFVAGGSGITHPLGYIRHLLEASADNLAAARRIKLAWVVRDRRNIGWVSDWLEELWRIDAGRSVLEIEIYVTRPSRKTTHHEIDMRGGRRVKWFAGRPQMEVILAGMLAPTRLHGQRGALAVNVCGPGSLADNVRAAVREKVDEARIEFSEESFTWS